MKEAPKIKKDAAGFFLEVNGKPFLGLGGEIHNSAASDPVYMEKNVWPRLRRIRRL